MSIFISYCHQDKDFVDKLAAHLVKNKVRVWIDRWELNVGDSIVDKVQSAIQEASALIVVISKASIKSEWCKKELSAGLLRELEEKRVMVLPVLIEDCDIPLFLREKLHADFRWSFDEGVETTLEAIAKVTSDTLGRIRSKDSNIDWGIDWGMKGKSFYLRITLLEHAIDKPYSVLTEIVALANEPGTARYEIYKKKGYDWLTRAAIIELLADFVEKNDLHFVLKNSLAETTTIIIKDCKSDSAYDCHVSCRRLGEDTGKNIFVDCGSQFIMVRDLIKKNLENLR